MRSTMIRNMTEFVTSVIDKHLGGEGSGYFGHAGRPGEVGGSGEGDANKFVSSRNWFHTTKVENVTSIEKNGFKDSSNSMFGKGVYFSGKGKAYSGEGNTDIKVKVSLQNPLVVNYVDFPDKYKEITGKKYTGVVGMEQDLMKKGYDGVYIKDEDWLVVYDKSKISLEKSGA